MVWCSVGGLGGHRLGCLGRQAEFGEVAKERRTGLWRKPGNPLAPDPLAPDPLDESTVTIPSERAMNRVLLSKRL